MRAWRRRSRRTPGRSTWRRCSNERWSGSSTPSTPSAAPGEPVAAQRRLGLIADVLSATRASGVPLRLRGGWAMDFFLGEATREHEGIDWFANGRAGSACRRGAPRPVRDPARPRRAEDAEDIARLEAALRRRAGG
ncbi:nucleotidyltransferase domain-containing protein [Streptomyces reticuli]|uniref:nucleotidyltransferase domain-containing protein n=1 Tax=Streptomyces reticuli TaxID=1926 RepID=UPI00099F1895